MHGSYHAQAAVDLLRDFGQRCPGGTGQIISRLVDDEIDVAIALTDALIAGIATGTSKGAYKLVGSYVMTPLNWAVITGQSSKYQNIDDLRGTPMGVSRIGRPAESCFCATFSPD